MGWSFLRDIGVETYHKEALRAANFELLLPVVRLDPTRCAGAVARLYAASKLCALPVADFIHETGVARLQRTARACVEAQQWAEAAHWVDGTDSVLEQLDEPDARLAYRSQVSASSAQR